MFGDTTWKVLGKVPDKKAKDNVYQNILREILINRRIKNVQEFLSPPPISVWFKGLPPKVKEALKLAQKIIKGCIKNNVPILVYGDYDVDGVCSTAILYSTLKEELKYENAQYFVPSRFSHGYGLSRGAIDEVLENFRDEKVLFVTVDTGITSVEEVEYLKSLGHLVIITDHHQKPKKLPKADCILWLDETVGAGVSWFLAKVLGSTNSQLLAFVALAIVTDLQPVLGLNRSLVKAGLDVFNRNPPLGLKKLFEVAGKVTNEITTYDLGWIIGPRLNSSGRLETADLSLQLLLVKNEKKALEIAFSLDEMNSKRQNKTLEMCGLASGIDQKNIPLLIISSHEEYHEGIIGLVASQLVQKYYRPSVVISLSGEIAKGSVRSIPGFNVIEFLRIFEDMFTSLGGHPMAAGFGIEKGKIPDLENKLLSEVKNHITEDMLKPVVDVDMEIPLTLVNHELLEEVGKMKPFGLGNPEPIFLSSNVDVAGANKVGKEGKHLSLRLYDGMSTHKGIWFNAPTDIFNVGVGSRVDVIYSLRENEFNGVLNVDLLIKDMRVVS